MAESLFIFLVLAFAAPIAYVVYGAIAASINDVDDYEDAACTASRRANITASVPQERRRMVEPVPPPFTFDTRPRLVPATTHVSITPAPAPRRTRRAMPEVVPMAAPAAAPVAVPDWPTRQTAEPEVVAVNRTAARFGSLEIRRD